MRRATSSTTNEHSRVHSKDTVENTYVKGRVVSVQDRQSGSNSGSVDALGQVSPKSLQECLVPNWSPPVKDP